MPWFAWIAIIAILVWGGITVYGMAAGKTAPWNENDADPEELEDLKRRIAELEAGRAKPELERRIDRLESRVDKRELRESAQDDWERRARDLGLDDGRDDGRDQDGNPPRSPLA